MSITSLLKEISNKLDLIHQELRQLNNASTNIVKYDLQNRDQEGNNIEQPIILSAQEYKEKVQPKTKEQEILRNINLENFEFYFSLY